MSEASADFQSAIRPTASRRYEGYGTESLVPAEQELGAPGLPEDLLCGMKLEMKGLRFSLPDERPVVDDSLGILLSRGWLLLSILLVVPLAGLAWSTFSRGELGSGIIGFVLSTVFAFMFWRGVLTRSTESNSRVYCRYQRPIRYWLILGLWFAFYGLGVGALFFGSAASID